MEGLRVCGGQRKMEKRERKEWEFQVLGVQHILGDTANRMRTHGEENGRSAARLRLVLGAG